MDFFIQSLSYRKFILADCLIKFRNIFWSRGSTFIVYVQLSILLWYFKIGIFIKKGKKFTLNIRISDFFMKIFDANCWIINDNIRLRAIIGILFLYLHFMHFHDITVKFWPHNVPKIFVVYEPVSLKFLQVWHLTHWNGNFVEIVARNIQHLQIL